jgi:type IV secretory pathway VirB4 component
MSQETNRADRIEDGVADEGERSYGEIYMGKPLESDALSGEPILDDTNEQEALSSDLGSDEISYESLKDGGYKYWNIPVEPPIDSNQGNTGSVVDIGAIKEVAAAIVPGQNKRAEKISREEKRRQKKQLKKDLRENKKEQKTLKSGVGKTGARYKSVKRRMKDHDKEIKTKTKGLRKQRSGAKDVISYIGYENMFKDGVCEVEYDERDRYGIYSETLSFEDISYQSAREDAQLNVHRSMAQLYNGFGSESLVQFTVVKRRIYADEIKATRFFDPAKQEDPSKKEYADIYDKILKEKRREGQSDIETSRYITYTVSAESPDQALPELAHIRNGVMQSLTKVGSVSERLSGQSRLKVLNEIMNEGRVFDFTYDNLSIFSPMTTKDFIAPLSLDFKVDGNSCYFKKNGEYAQVLIIRGFGSEISDRALSDVINLPIPMVLSWFAQGMDMTTAITEAKKQISFIDNEIMKIQQKAVSKGYSWEAAIPAELSYSKADALAVLRQLQENNQRMFDFTGLIYTSAETLEELSANVNNIIRVAAKNSLEIDELHYLQKEAFNSILPLGHNHMEVSRSILSDQIATFIPFAAVDLFEVGGNWYGQSKENNNLIICDRRKQVSPMGFICGITGAGKSFSTKNEIENTVLNNPDDQIIVLDRAGEYSYLIEKNNGSEIKLSVESKTYLNPLGFEGVSHMSRREQIAFKIDAMLAQAAANALESGKNLDDAEKSLIARCVELAYRHSEEKGSDVMPVLGDFHSILKVQEEEKAKDLALRYEMYVNGVMSYFNNQTNADFTNKLININFKELQDSMLVFALINACEIVRNQMYFNYSQGIRTHLYIEEIQSLFKYPAVINYITRLVKEGRKFGLILTGITQNSIAMLEHESARDIVLAASFIMLLQQSMADRRVWSDLLGLSPIEELYIDESIDRGDGLLIVGAKRVPFKGAFPKDNVLFQMFDTDPNNIAKTIVKKKAN